MQQSSIFGAGILLLTFIYEPMFPHIPGYFYYISIAMQAICVFHCVRKGTQQKWIWLIVFLPYIGCIAYIFTEIIPMRDLGNLQSGLGLLVNPAARIRRLEHNLRFTDTFNNRVMLADAYMAVGRTDEAIELYTSSLTGAFTENEYVIKQLIGAYFENQRDEELISLAEKILVRPEFARSKAQIQYSCALGYTGDSQR